MNEQSTPVFKRPKGTPTRLGGVMRIQFDDWQTLDGREGEALAQAALLQPHPHQDWFNRGMQLARELALARSHRPYTDELQVAQGMLFFKCLNDLRGAVLLSKGGYALQAFPCLRSALETAEVMDYLERNRDQISDYLSGAGRFERDLSWLRAELPSTEERRGLFNFLNYMTHANFQGLAVYGYRDVPGTDDHVMLVGPFVVRDMQMSPVILAAALVAYPVRVMWRCDPQVVPASWVASFEQFDEQTGMLADEVRSRADTDGRQPGAGPEPS